MVAYNFQKRFAPLVERGEKTQTIRAHRRSRHAGWGEPIQLYTGMRTKSCRKLVDPEPLCTRNDNLTLNHDFVALNGSRLSADEAEKFAIADGFSSFAEMRDWFEKVHDLPFEGVLIKWRMPEVEPDGEPSAREAASHRERSEAGDK